jgi:hypothetical protein
MVILQEDVELWSVYLFVIVYSNFKKLQVGAINDLLGFNLTYQAIRTRSPNY